MPVDGSRVVPAFRPCGRTTWAAPWGMYAALRDHDPVHHVVPAERPEHDYWVLTRHEHVHAAARERNCSPAAPSAPSTSTPSNGVRTLFRERGVAGVSGIGMAEVAAAAGCSRATLYRYFPNRQALFVAFAGREAQRVVAGVWRGRAAADPATALLDTLTAILAAVRETPHLAVWFEPVNAGVVAQLADSSEVVERLARDFVAGLRPDLDAAAARRLGRWTVRAVVSLLTLPAADPAEEREMLRAFVVPFLADERLPV